MSERASGPDRDPLLDAFRRRVRETIARDLERERAEGDALRAEIVTKLREAIAAARERGDCREAWLFGSFAWGLPTERSDVDVLVVGCRDLDALGGWLWRGCGRPVHVLDHASAPPSLVARATSEGLAL